MNTQLSKTEIKYLKKVSGSSVCWTLDKFHDSQRAQDTIHKLIAKGLARSEKGSRFSRLNIYITAEGRDCLTEIVAAEKAEAQKKAEEVAKAQAEASRKADLRHEREADAAANMAYIVHDLGLDLPEGWCFNINAHERGAGMDAYFEYEFELEFPHPDYEGQTKCDVAVEPHRRRDGGEGVWYTLRTTGYGLIPADRAVDFAKRITICTALAERMNEYEAQDEGWTGMGAGTPPKA